MQDFLSAARVLIACPHPRGQVQTFALDKPIPAASFPSRRIIVDRCQQCGAVRMQGDEWIAPLGVTTLTAALGAH